MPASYKSGVEIRAGDQVRYRGEPGEIEFIVDADVSDPDSEWFLQEYGVGVMIRRNQALGQVYVTDTEQDDQLELVSRGRRR